MLLVDEQFKRGLSIVILLEIVALLRNSMHAVLPDLLFYCHQSEFPPLEILVCILLHICLALVPLANLSSCADIAAWSARVQYF